MFLFVLFTMEYFFIYLLIACFACLLVSSIFDALRRRVVGDLKDHVFEEPEHATTILE